MAKKVRIGLEEIGEYFESLEDPQAMDINQKHPFISVIVIAVMAVFGSADGPTAIAKWAGFQAEFLCAGIWCCPTAFRRKMSFCGFCRHFSQKLSSWPVSTPGWKRCAVEWKKQRKSLNLVLAVDGKTLQGGVMIGKNGLCALALGQCLGR